MGEHREFGQRSPGTKYHLRPGAYAIIPDTAGRIAVMQIGGGKGACFLPGGGAEPGEAPEQTLARELREECGRTAHIIRRLGEATQLISRGNRPLAKRGIYFEAEFTGDSPVCPTERDHELLWLPPAEAIARLKHESQRWAVQAWMRSRSVTPPDRAQTPP